MPLAAQVGKVQGHPLQVVVLGGSGLGLGALQGGILWVLELPQGDRVLELPQRDRQGS